MAEFFRPAGWDSGKPKKRRRKVRGTPASGDIAVVCPWCSKELRVESKWVGYTVSCPYCEDRFVAEASPASEAVAASATRKKRPSSRHAPQSPPEPPPGYNDVPQGELSANNESYNEGPPDEPAPPGMKKCPYCAELIKTEAILCKHCKSQLD